MNAINDHIYAIKESFDQLFKGKYWLYLIPSLAISVIFFFVSSIISGVFSFVSEVENVPLVGSYLLSGVETTKGFFSYLGDIFYQFIILTALSPIYCLLSEKVDNDFSGAKFNGGIVRIMTDLLRAIFIAVIALLFYIVLMAVWWFFAWITGFHLLDEIIYFIIGAFFIGFSFYDFSLERYEVGTFGSWSFGFGKIPYMFITGGLFSLCFKVPIFGVILSPFLLTIISTVVYLKMHNKIKNSSENSDSKPNTSEL